MQERRADQSVEIGYALLVGAVVAGVLGLAGMLLLHLLGGPLGLQAASRESLEPVVLGAAGLAGVGAVVRVLRGA